MLMCFSVVDAITNLTSTSITTTTQVPTVTIYTGTLGSPVEKREEQINTLSIVRYRRNAQLLGDLLPAVNLPRKYSRTDGVARR